MYQDGKFYDLEKDKLEKNPIAEMDMTVEMKKIRDELAEEIAKVPKWQPVN